MRQSVIGGVALAILVALFSIVTAAAGVHKNPSLGWVFALVATVINVGVVVWTLRRTRDEGRRYGGQLLAGLVMALVAAVLIFCNSLLVTQVLFPDYLDEARDVQEEVLVTRSAGAPEEQIAAQRQVMDAFMTPKAQAGIGAVMTVITTMIVTLIAAIFIRKKD
jgi:hypothetical protein